MRHFIVVCVMVVIGAQLAMAAEDKSKVLPGFDFGAGIILA
jgi:hypothetical protein